MADAKTLFRPVVSIEKLYPHFEKIRTWPGAESERRMLDDVYQDLDDPEGNFLEQFQTTGFAARLFELYLFAYFCRSGFVVDRNHPNPDFLVSRQGATVAVEATTVNPSTSGVLNKLGKKITELSTKQLREYQRHELPIRFGSPLSSKMKKRYWELEHCRNLPFVLAIEAFHEEESLVLSDFALSGYLFGLDQTGSWSQAGELQVETTQIGEHQLGEKRISSNFFAQPGAEHVSAVIFTNSGTGAKFARMGYQHGFGCDAIQMVRTGYCFNPDPDAMDPTFFSYNLDEPPIVESWGQGLVILHNPNCLHPVPRDLFVDAVQGYVEGGMFKSDHPAWHPISSKTLIFYVGDVKKELGKRLPKRRPQFAIGAITKQAFQAACGFAVLGSNPIGEEHGWFCDETESFLGVVIRDKIDKDWGYVVLARDEHFQFRAIDVDVSLPTRYQAGMKLQLRMAELISSPQRIFPQKCAQEVL